MARKTVASTYPIAAGSAANRKRSGNGTESAHRRIGSRGSTSSTSSAGKERVMTMGCCGIGVSRIVGAAIEQNHVANGIVWPEPLGPFDVMLGGQGGVSSPTELLEVRENVRMGRTILRYYYDQEHGTGLARNNGSLSRREYPDLIFERLRTRWFQQ